MESSKNRYLIFGGSGSLGTTLIKRLCVSQDNIVLVYSRDESKHWALKNKFSEFKNLMFTIGDIRDKDRVRQSISRFKPTHIIIASALKHVDVCEYAPSESIQTNIVGPQNVAECVEENLEEFSQFLTTVLMVSTDKACSPINVYGMSKAISERVVLEKSRLNSSIKFVAVRYGNVLESRGSIIPLFLYQAKNGETLTVTDDRMTRFVMTLDESVDLILNCMNKGESGELFVPKLKSMRIIDLATIISNRYNVGIKMTGIRSGEKLHESMINSTESLRTIEHDTMFVVKPVYDTTIYNDELFEYDSRNTMSLNELEHFLVERGYLEREISEFDDVQIDAIRKTSINNIIDMTR